MPTTERLLTMAVSINLMKVFTINSNIFGWTLRNWVNFFQNATARKESNGSTTEERKESIPNQAPQPIVQNDHNYAQAQRANESNVVEANSAQQPLFVQPLAPAPQVHKRKENAPENVLPAKKAHFDPPMRSPVESHKTSREPPRESSTEPPRRSPVELPRQPPAELPRRSPNELSRRQPNELPRCSPVELPRQSAQHGTGFTKTNRMDRIEPDLTLVKSEYPTEQMLTFAQPAKTAQVWNSLFFLSNIFVFGNG